MRKLCAFVLGLGVPAVAALGVATAAAAPADELQAAKAASARYHSLEQASAAGFVRGSGCEALPGVGAMGFHYVNPPLLGDPALDPAQPEVLLYAPKPNGGLSLAGVEYFAADADQNPATDADRPSLFGRAFDGPMLGHAPGMPVHYDLHVWFWQANPNGLFAAWNPAVTCS